MWYLQYKGQCIGRILHALYMYCGLRVAETAKIGDGNIMFEGKLFATYTWKENTDIPIISFIKPDNVYETKQEVYHNILDNPELWWTQETIDKYNKLINKEQQHA